LVARVLDVSRFANSARTNSLDSLRLANMSRAEALGGLRRRMLLSRVDIDNDIRVVGCLNNARETDFAAAAAGWLGA
jgi:hypothetical protein